MYFQSAAYQPDPKILQQAVKISTSFNYLQHFAAFWTMMKNHIKNVSRETFLWIIKKISVIMKTYIQEILPERGYK